MIKVKRIYDPVEKDDGGRFLVERLWPRGIKKEALHMDAWLKDAAPTSALRTWFSHDLEKWEEFKRRYFTELDSRRESLQPIRDAARKGNATLLFSAHDLEHNNAVALKEYLGKFKG